MVYLIRRKTSKLVGNRLTRKRNKLKERWYYKNTNCENEHPAHAVVRKSSSIETMVKALKMTKERDGWLINLFKGVKE
jgi:hypothetical protein